MNISILDSNFTAFLLIDDHIGINWSTRYNDTGDMELILPKTKEYGTLIDTDMYVSIPDSEYLMLITEIDKKSDPIEGGEITIKGFTLDKLLDRRVVHGSTTTFSGPIENVVFGLIRTNCIDTTANRKFPNFILVSNADPRLASIIIEAKDYKGENLFDAVKNVCDSNGVGFKMGVDSNNQIYFMLYMGIDRSWGQSNVPPIVFSPEYENLVSSNYVKNVADYKTFSYVEYTVTTKTIVVDPETEEETVEESKDTYETTTQIASASGYGRRETTFKAEDENIEDPILAAKTAIADAKEELISTNKKEAFDGELSEDGQFTYGNDYNLGDIVQVIDEDGHEGTCRISEIVISEDSSGFFIVPTFTFINE